MTEAVDSRMRETIIAGILSAVVRRGPASHAGQQPAGAQRHRNSYEYSVEGVRVCRAVFLFANSCSKYTLNKVQSHLESSCIVPREHGRRSAPVWYVLSD